MKILVVSQYFYPENFRINALCRDLVQRGHSVTVLTAYPQYPEGKFYTGYGFSVPYDKVWNGVRIERVKAYPRGKNLFGLLRNCVSFVQSANKWVKRCKERYDLVYVFGISPITAALPAVSYKLKFKIPMIYNLQDLWPESVHEVLGIRFPILTFLINMISNRIYKHSDKILCASRGFVDNLEAKGVPRERLAFWPQFCDDLGAQSDSEIWNDKSESFKIVFAGNIGYAQGLDLLIEAAKRLKNSGIVWYLVGDGRAKLELLEETEKHGLWDEVRFVGRVSEAEAQKYIASADCAFLSFKDNDLFSMLIPAKLQTYLSCRVPILAAVRGESAAIVDDAKCGIVADPDVDSLCNAIMAMTTLSSDERQKMADNGRLYYETNFMMKPLMDELERTMNDCVASTTEPNCVMR